MYSSPAPSLVQILYLMKKKSKQIVYLQAYSDSSIYSKFI